MQNIILHLDMNSYFASVEQQDNPAFRGRPLGVCEHLGGIIIAASIQAKLWGITTGTPVWEAKKLYPKIILTPTHPARYRFYHQKFVKVASDYTEKVERYSIDEVFLDITKVCNTACWPYKANRPYKTDPFEEAVKVAQEIKKRMTIEVGDYLTCSIGIAENKLLAKIASDLKKPDGLAVVCGRQEYKGCLCSRSAIVRDAPNLLRGAAQRRPLYISKDGLYHRLNLTDIPGIGHRQEKNLNELGIKTLLDLKNFPKSRLVARFGRIAGHHLYNLGQLEGSFKPEVREDENIKSVGHMYTLPARYREGKYFIPVLYKLCEMVARRLRRQGLTGNVLHLRLEAGNRNYFGKSKRLKYYLSDGREIFLAAAEMRADMLCGSNMGQVKFIGITIGGLRPAQNQQSLFGGEEKRRLAVKALDKINEKYGDFTICRAPVLRANAAFCDSIGFGRIREGWETRNLEL